MENCNMKPEGLSKKIGFLGCSLFLLGVLSMSVISCSTGPKRTFDSVKTETHLQFEFAPGEIPQMCEDLVVASQAKLDAIATRSPGDRTVENTLLAFEEAMADLDEVGGRLSVMSYISPDKRTHDEGSACDDKITQYSVSVMTRKDLYEALRAVQPVVPEQKRLLEETLRDFRKNGLELPADQLAQVRELLQKLSSLENRFTKNVNEDKTTIEFTSDELDGAFPDFLARLKKTPDGRYIVTTSYPDYLHVIENCTKGETRKKMASAYVRRAVAANTPLIEEALVLRQQVAQRLGYKNWLHYRVDGRMAGTPEKVLDFLSGLRTKLSKRNKADQAKLLAFKKTLLPAGDLDAKELHPWDIFYLANQYKKKHFQLDDEMIKEYFPADRTFGAIMELYSKLFGIRFEPKMDEKVWSPSVRLYEVRDAETGELIASIYTDLLPRELKYKHFAAFTLASGRMDASGRYRLPLSAIVGNFNPPTGDKPALLTHDQVETLFHEFGHIMHQTLTRAPYASLSGTKVARDFVEAPSQMLENWIWTPAIISQVSGHYLDPKKKLPSSVIKKMIAAKDFNEGYAYTRQLHLGLLDTSFHTAVGKVDTAAVYFELFKEIVGLEPLREGNFVAAFTHLMGAYDAGYYGYLWSKVYAQDMFARFEKEGLLNPTVGMSYRRTILASGRMRPPEELLKEFLGREPNSKAFFKLLKVK